MHDEIGLTLIGKACLPDLSQARLPTTLMYLMWFNAARHSCNLDVYLPYQFNHLIVVMNYTQVVFRHCSKFGGRVIMIIGYN